MSSSDSDGIVGGPAKAGTPSTPLKESRRTCYPTPLTARPFKAQIADGREGESGVCTPVRESLMVKLFYCPPDPPQPPADVDHPWSPAEVDHPWSPASADHAWSPADADHPCSPAVAGHPCSPAEEG
ncbi:cuticle collagen 2C-like [Dendroctonus ponderosae]|uniref:cuticle collagen 2C-like n=1 Tax=Dendroctonus ponderosae TaxID=77166 RepID=UPI0020351018|nr:cuticle collagen 2C-like [Dendroctonus ponderosae]